jgi:hypothetical protein
MLFGETYVRRLETLLKQAPCPVCIIMSNPALIHCTRIGKFVIQSRGEEQEAGVLQRLMQSFRPRHGQGVAETFLLDEAMRERLAKLNPHATAAMSRRLLASSSRGFWDTDEATLEALRSVYDDLEDRMEGVGVREVSG